MTKPTLCIDYDPKWTGYYKKIGTSTACRTALSLMIPGLVNFHEENDPDQKITEKIFVDINSSPKSGLVIGFKNQDQRYFLRLEKLLNEAGINANIIKGEENFPKNIYLKDEEHSSDSLLEIKHKDVKKFLRDICNVWKISDKNMIRDLYCNTSGNEKGLKKGISDKKREDLQELFDQHHLSENMSQMRRNSPTTFFSAVKIRRSNAYQFINATINVPKKGPVKLAPCKIQNPSNQQKPSNEKFSIIEGGNAFLEISDLITKHPDFKVAHISPDNRYRIGGAAFYGGLGSLEEFFTRVTDYIVKAVNFAEFNSDDNQHDPMRSLIEFLKTRQPNGKNVTLTEFCGVPYLKNAEIPEYISSEDIKAYLYMATDLLYLAKEKKYNVYAKHKENPQLVEKVEYITHTGEKGLIDMIGMVGIDGRKLNFLQRKAAFEKTEKSSL